MIAEGTSDSNGDLVIEGSADLEINLPSSSDENALDTCDYSTNGCNPEDSHLKGAKIWLVLSSDYNEVTNSLIAWHQADYLYETNLIQYFNNVDGQIVVPAGDYIEFYSQFDVDAMATTDAYVIYTTVNPVTA